MAAAAGFLQRQGGEDRARVGVLLQERLCRWRGGTVALWGRPGIRRVLPRLPAQVLASGPPQRHPACRAAGRAAAWEGLPGARLRRRGCYAALWAADAFCGVQAEPTCCQGAA